MSWRQKGFECVFRVKYKRMLFAMEFLIIVVVVVDDGCGLFFTVATNAF